MNRLFCCLALVLAPLTLAAVPRVTVADAFVREGDSGGTNAVFRVQLEVAAALPVTVAFATSDDTAHGGTDYVATNGVLTFAPGETVQEIAVQVNGDTTPELNELFLLHLSNPTNATLLRGEAVGTIINDDFAAGQLHHFAWSGVPSPQVPGRTFAVTLTALDGHGNVVSDFNGAVPLQAFGGSGRPSPLVLSEIRLSDLNGVTLVNTTTNPLSIGGWRVVFYDSTRWPAPRLVFTIPDGTVVAPGDGVALDEGGSAPGVAPYFRLGQTLIWGNDTGPDVPRVGAVVLLERTGLVQDAVCIDSAIPSAIYAPVQLAYDDWQTDGPRMPWMKRSNLSTTIYSAFHRAGNQNHRNSSDWLFGTAWPIGLTNQSLQLPFADAASQAVTPPLAMDFVNGTWKGNITVDDTVSPMSLWADDGNGHTGRSAPFAALVPNVPNDLRVTLVSNPTALVDSGLLSHVKNIVTVTNPGPDVSSNVVAELQWSYLFGSNPYVQFEVSQGTAEIGFNFVPTIEGNYIARSVTASFGDLAPGATATLQVAAIPEMLTRVLPPTSMTTVALVKRTQPDLNPVNNIATTVGEISYPCAPLAAGAVAWWRMETDGTDAFGSHPAILSEGVTLGAGYVGGAVALDGHNGQLTVADAADLNFGPEHDLTIEAWIRATPGDREIEFIVDKRQTTPSGALGYGFYLDHGLLGLQLNDLSMIATFSTIDLPGSGDLRDDHWHHVAAVVSRSRAGSLWVDGEQVAAGLEGARTEDLTNTNPLRIGAASGAGIDGYFAGRIDEVTVYRRALDTEESAGPSGSNVTSIFHSGAHGKCITQFEVTFLSPAVENGRATQPGILGQPFEVKVAVTNTGLLEAPAFLTFYNSDDFPGATMTASSGAVTLKDGKIVASLGSLAPGGFATANLTFISTNVGANLTFIVDGPDSAFMLGGGDLFVKFVPVDTDHDGLSDEWEQKYGFNPNDPTDASSDTDGDGLTALEEFKAGTSPMDPDSTLTLRHFNWGLSFDGKAGRIYSVQKRDSLTSDDWREIETYVIDSDRVVNLGVSTETAYYRVILTYP